MMGDTVNIASRLESANKQYGTRILISETTYELAKDDFEARKIDSIIVVGKSEPVTIYQLLGKKGQVEQPVLEIKGLYEEAYGFYLQQDWKKAIASLEQALGINPQDGPSKLLVDRVQYFTNSPPPEGWDGVWTMTKK